MKIFTQLTIHKNRPTLLTVFMSIVIGIAGCGDNSKPSLQQRFASSNSAEILDLFQEVYRGKYIRPAFDHFNRDFELREGSAFAFHDVFQIAVPEKPGTRATCHYSLSGKIISIDQITESAPASSNSLTKTHVMKWEIVERYFNSYEPSGTVWDTACNRFFLENSSLPKSSELTVWLHLDPPNEICVSLDPNAHSIEKEHCLTRAL